MKRFFAPNITRAGRIARVIYAFLTLGIGIALVEKVRWLSLIFFAFAALAFFEAARGWCLLRACGIKTRL